MVEKINETLKDVTGGDVVIYGENGDYEVISESIEDSPYKVGDYVEVYDDNTLFKTTERCKILKVVAYGYCYGYLVYCLKSGSIKWIDIDRIQK